MLKLKDWAATVLEDEANSRYSRDRKNCEKEAEKVTTEAMTAFDFSTIAGIEPEFILRFTALVTIVFVVLTLNLVGDLKTEQAGTILAAIAGYVLGQVTSRQERHERSALHSTASEGIKGKD